MIELTKEETQAVVNDLSRLPFKDVVGLIQFFNNKLAQANAKKQEEEPTVEEVATKYVQRTLKKK